MLRRLATADALTAAGAARCWGQDDYGQSTAPDGRFTRLSLGAYTSCGVSAAGAIRCWGDRAVFLPPAD